MGLLNGDRETFGNLTVQRTGIRFHLVIGHVGVNLGSAYPLVPEHPAHGLKRNAMRQEHRRGVRVPS